MRVVRRRKERRGRKVTHRIRNVSVTITKEYENGVLEVKRGRKLTLRIRYEVPLLPRKMKTELLRL